MALFLIRLNCSKQLLMNTLETTSTQNSGQELNYKIVKKLSASQIYNDYKKAFSRVSGLPLTLQPVDPLQPAMQSHQENSLCTMLRRINNGCPFCLALQSELEHRAKLEPVNLCCFAGICQTAVPIRMGDQVIAFLKTGQVLLRQPNKETFSKIAQQLLKWVAKVDLNSIEHAYFQSKVLDQNQYKAFVQLLSIFAKHLGAISNSIAIKESFLEPEVIQSAKGYISDHYYEHLTLAQISRAVNMSVRYFCKTFKRYSGMTFTGYLSRLRVEQAKILLLDPHKHISEVAFEVGFESLSQFNRSFKRITGKTPTEYRQDIKNLHQS